jgi:hypothetical protein
VADVGAAVVRAVRPVGQVVCTQDALAKVASDVFAPMRFAKFSFAFEGLAF